MKKLYIIPALYLILILTSCADKPVNYNLPVEKIAVGYGPEDMVLDTASGYERLLVSCASRRENHPGFGEIMSYDLKSGSVKILVRSGEPGDVVFRPHGIFLDGKMLYIISHEEEPDHHTVMLYRVTGDTLQFTELIATPLLHSPNALVTGPYGEIYVTNDSGKRGSMAEKFFKLKRASVVRLVKSGSGEWIPAVVAEKLGYPAGINRIGKTIYVGDAILHRLHIYRIEDSSLKPDGEIKGLRGNDNIRICDGKIVVPGHVKPFKFVGHAGDSAKLSPVEVFRVDPENQEIETLYYNDGSVISGGSTAILTGDQLFICQVFDPYILRVELTD